MDGSLTTWFNGVPVATVDSTGDMGTWYNGTVFTYLEPTIGEAIMYDVFAIITEFGGGTVNDIFGTIG